MNYYIVTAVCGHVGRNFYVEKDFPVKASSKKVAAAIVRNTPRVKHDLKEAIKFVREVTFDEYIAQISCNNHDNYFLAGNVQIQRSTCFDLEVHELSDLTGREFYKGKSVDKRYRGHGKVSKKAYVNRYSDIEEMEDCYFEAV